MHCRLKLISAGFMAFMAVKMIDDRCRRARRLFTYGTNLRPKQTGSGMSHVSPRSFYPNGRHFASFTSHTLNKTPQLVAK